MIQTMRRKDRALSGEEAMKVLQEGEYGILSTCDGQGQPYATPVNYVLEGSKLYFHCALSGQKLDNIRENPKVCFATVGATKVLPQRLTSRYESAIAYGQAQLVEDPGEKRMALLLLCAKYAPEDIAHARGQIRAMLEKTGVVRLDIDLVTGKANRG